MEMKIKSGALHAAKTWLGALALVALLAVVAAGCGGDDSPAAAGTDAKPAAAGKPTVVRTAFYKAISNANLAKLQANAGKAISVKYLNFVSGVDVLRAVQTGDLDLAPIAANQFLVAVDQGMDIQAVSGVNRGGIDIVIAKKLVPAGKVDETQMAYTGTEPWKLLEGKKMAILRGTYPDIALRKYLSDHGIDPAKQKLVSYPDFGSMVQAISKGEVDAFAAQNPFPVMARLQGVAVHLDFPYPPLRPEPGKVGDFDSLQMAMVIVGRRDWIQKHPDAVQAYVAALSRSNEQLESDRDSWIAAAVDYTGLDKTLLTASIDPVKAGKAENLWQNDLLDINLYQGGLEAWVPILKDLGYIQKDITAQIPDHLVYDYLEKATGKTRAEVGGA